MKLGLDKIVKELQKRKDQAMETVSRLERAILALDHKGGISKLRGSGRTKRRMSAAVRAKIARKQRANWRAKKATGKA